MIGSYFICHGGEQASVTACIEELWSGAGAFGTSSLYADCLGGSSCDASIPGDFVYKNLLNVQPSPQATAQAIPSQCWGAPCWEPGLAAIFYTVTGMGTASATAAGYTMPPIEVPEPQACPYGYRGYPCFRPDSLPIILLMGDEPFKECYLPDGEGLGGNCVTIPQPAMDPRDFPIVAGAVNDLGAKIIGIQGNGGGTTLLQDMEHLCVQTGSVNPNGDPYVFQGADANAADAIADGIRELTSTLPLDMSAVLEDDDTDSVDTVAAFVDYIEVSPEGTAECIDWPDIEDTDGDGHLDTYIAVPAGMPVCWKIHVKSNTTVEPTEEVQIYKAFIHLWGNGVTLLDTRTIYFVVPPEVSGTVVD